MYQAKTNWSRIGVRVLALALVVTLAAYFMPMLVAEAYTPAIVEGNRLPDITLQDSDGKSVKLAPKAGRMLYVLYWNDTLTGLGKRNSGRIALLALNSLVDEFDAKGIDVVVVHPSGAQYVEDWVELMDFRFPVLWGNTNVMEEMVGRYLVSSFGLDSKGTVRILRTGFGLTIYDSIIHLRYDLDRMITGDDAKHQTNMPAVGSTAPAMVLKDLTGKMVDTSVFRGESPVCFLFWDAGCGFSRSTQVRLIELYPEFYARGVEFVSIDVSPESPWHTLQYFAADSHNAMPFINLRDEFAMARQAYGVFGTPSMVVADKNGVITFSGSGDDIHNADLHSVLGAVAGPPLPGGQPGSVPSGERQPLVPVSGDFDGLKVFSDPLLNQSQIDALGAGLRQDLDQIYHNLGVDGRLLANSDAQLVFYADPLRYYEDAGTGCSSIGYCIVDLNGPSARLFVQWVNDVDTTLFVARHELVHALLRLRIKQVPPLWFDEGCADAFSRNRDAEYYTVMHNFDHKPSAELLSTWWGDAQYEADAREIAHAVINYILHTRGHEGFLNLLASMEAGNSLEKAVELTFNINFQRFWESFWNDVSDAAERSWANIVNESKFEDVKYDTFGHHQANILAELGVIPASGKFDPRGDITRGEFAQLLVDTLWLPQDLVGKLAHPTSRLDRYDAAAMVVEALGLKTLSPPEDWDYFSDWESVPEYAKDHVWTAFCHTIIDRNLLLGGSYDEGQRVTVNRYVPRIEAAVWIARAFHLRLYLLDQPQVQTLNVGYEDVEPGEDDQDPSTAPGDEPSSGQSGSGPWLWVALGGGVVILAGGGLFIFLKRRKSKISA